MNTKLFENYFSGNCSPEAYDEARRWIEENIFSSEFDALSLELLEKMPYIDDGDCRRMLGQVHRRINSVDSSRFRTVRGKTAKTLIAAASVLVLIVSAWVVNSIVGRPPGLPVDIVEYYAPCGQTEMIILPDSTSVMLYADTRLLFDRNNFASSRQVWLYGDAYFNVSHQNGVPFDVLGSKSSIRVLGTRFSVLSHDRDDDFEISLYEGRVRLASSFNDRSDTITIGKGELVRIDKKLGAISMQNIPGMDIDTTNIVYSDARLSDIAARLERRFGKTIILDDNIYTRKNPRLYLMFEAGDSLDNVISAICILSGLEKKVIGHNQILLTSK